MTVPPDETNPPAADAPLDFDPYRFGKPDHPIAPEYAPPGYVAPTAPPPPTPVYPPPPQQPPYGYPYPPTYPPQTNNKAVISLVLGILAILLSWTSVWDLLLIVPAIVLGALGRADANRNPNRTGRGLATGGLACGIIALVLAVAATVYIFYKIKPCFDEYGTDSSQLQTCATDRLLDR